MTALILAHSAVAAGSLAVGVAAWCLLTADRRSDTTNDWYLGWWFWAWLAGMTGMAAIWMWLRAIDV